MRNGRAFQRVLWAPAIKEIGGGLLPTPTTQDTIAHPNAIITANNRRLSRTGSTHSLNLQDVLMLPTPTTNDSKNASLPPSQAERDGLAGAMLRDDSIPTGAATYLNPSFVEEMMGFPVGWTV